MLIRLISILTIAILALSSCQSKDENRTSIMSGAFAKHTANAGDGNDIESIRQSGELIIATISGPQTYYEYRGLPMGLHYALISRFAEEEGVRVRVELVKDTLALADILSRGEADVAVYPLSSHLIKREHLLAAGFSGNGCWAVNDDCPSLAKALDEWFDTSLVEKVKTEEKERFQRSHQVTRKARAVYLSRDRGVISVYDNLFRQAAATTGWDWRLIAAQCYQESAFDPNARSYAGAQGLMQLMPATATELGLAAGEVKDPEKNVMAGARYIVKLTNTFSDIRDPQERIKFVLAAYNGGSLHVRDAMALAKKYGKRPHVWDDVAPFILALQQPRYYTDPVVRHGYMIGSETAGYVQNILERWRDYGGNIAVTHAPQLPADHLATNEGNPNSAASHDNSAHPKHRKNRFTSDIKILRPDDPEFNQMEE